MSSPRQTRIDGGSNPSVGAMDNMKIVLVPVNQNIKVIGEITEDNSNVIIGRTAHFEKPGQCVVSMIENSGSQLCYVCVSNEDMVRASVALSFGTGSEYSRLQKSSQELLGQKKLNGRDTEKLQKVQDRLRFFMN